MFEFYRIIRGGCFVFLSHQWSVGELDGRVVHFLYQVRAELRDDNLWLFIFCGGVYYSGVEKSNKIFSWALVVEIMEFNVSST